MFAHWNKAMLAPALVEGEITKVLSEFLGCESIRSWE
jgi:hypothetical protein